MWFSFSLKTKKHTLLFFTNITLAFHSDLALFDLQGFSGGRNCAFMDHTSCFQLSRNVKLGYIESLEMMSDSGKGICGNKSVSYGVII